MLKNIALVIAVFLTAALPARAFETVAKAAYILDHTTGTVLLEKNSDDPLPPASMSKLMTLYMAFEALNDGRLKIDDVLPVSKHAASYGGSTMFLDPRDRVTVEDLLRGVIVLSGNDACVVLAEALSPDGTEGGFARMMTERGRDIGLTNSNFTNSNGWPQVGHRMSVHDLAIIADRLITDFPAFYPLFAEREFLFDGRAPQNKSNRNPLLSLNIGADGLKTGHTQEAGYGLVGSAKQGDRRIVFAITGMDSTAQRAEEAEKVVNWAFRQFSQRDIVKKGAIIAEAEVWGADVTSIGLAAADDLSVLVPVLVRDSIDAQVIYRGPLEAPIEVGQEIAELVVNLDGLPETRMPLVAAEGVAAGGFVPKVKAAALSLWQQFNGAQSPL